MSFNSTFYLNPKKIGLLLSQGMSTLSDQQRVEAEIPLLVATLDELDQFKLNHKEKTKVVGAGLNENEISACCLFIGYPRSGHSLVSSILDAHQEISLSHELHILNLIDKRELSQQEIFSLITQASSRFAEVNNRWGDYQYKVPNEHNGIIDNLKVVGDKKAGATTQILYKKPYLMKQLQSIVKKPIKVIHIIRNPFDNIATLYKKQLNQLDTAIALYESLCESNFRISNQLPSDNIIHIQHEDFISNFNHNLEKLVNFLGLKVSSQYLQNTKKIVYSSPNLSRNSINWSLKDKRKIRKIINRYEFLKGYTFEN